MSATLSLGADYIRLTQPDMDYLAGMIRVVQQQLRDYINALQDMSYMTSVLKFSV